MILLIDYYSQTDKQAKIYTERQIDSYRQIERQTERLIDRKLTNRLTLTYGMTVGQSELTY